MIRFVLVFLTQWQFLWTYPSPGDGFKATFFAGKKKRVARMLGWIVSLVRDLSAPKQRHDESKRVLISMCSYQGERWIDEAIQSVVDLKYSNWHLFIVDDGSSDATFQKIENWKRLHPNRLTIKKLQENTHPSSIMNHGLRFFMTNPEFDVFTVLDQDDVAMPEFLNIGLRLMNDLCQVIRCRNGRYNADFSEFFFEYNATSQVFITREVIERVGLRKDRSFNAPADADYLRRLYADASTHGYAVVSTRKICQKMRVHGANTILKSDTAQSRMFREKLG